MRMENYTPFPNLRFFNTDNEGREFGVLVVKGTYAVGLDGRLAVAGEQQPLVLTDDYHGDLNTSSLRHPSDIVPVKPRADLIVNAVARAPGGQASRSWTCRVRVEGDHVVEKRIRVTGPREWRPLWGVSERARATMTEAEHRRVFGGWRLSEPEPTLDVPIRYELAFGGLLPTHRAGSDEPFYEPEERNPVGRGWIDPEITPQNHPVPAPQIEDADRPIVDAYARPAPAGFGAIPPVWMPRRPLGGTFDDHWREHVWPNWPMDYQAAYHNSATPDLTYPTFLRGDESLVLSGITHDERDDRIRLPNHMVIADVALSNGSTRTLALNLDTVLLDVESTVRDEWRAYLSWRLVFDPSGAEGLAFALVSLA